MKTEKNSNDNTYGKNLRRARKEKGFSQEDLAILSSYSAQQISYYENGRRKISQKAAECLSKILDISVYELWLPDETEKYLQESRVKHEKRKPLIEKMYNIVFQLFELYGYEFVDLKCLDGKEFFVRPLSDDSIKEIIKVVCGLNYEGRNRLFLSGVICQAAKFLPKTYIVIKGPAGREFAVSEDEFASCVSGIAQFVQCNILSMTLKSHDERYDFIETVLKDYFKL